MGQILFRVHVDQLLVGMTGILWLSLANHMQIKFERVVLVEFIVGWNYEKLYVF